MSLPEDVLGLRWALCGIVVLWAVLASRSRRSWTLLGGLLFAVAGIGFWALSLGRPYGLLVDPQITRQTAEIAVAAATRAPGEGFLAGDQSPRLARVIVARAGLPADLYRTMANVLPLVALVAIATLIAAFAQPGDRAQVAALSWLAFSTGDLDALRGAGFLPGAFGRPWASLILVAVVAAVLLLARLPLPARAALPAAMLPMAVWLYVPSPAAATTMGAVDRLLLLTLDQSPWLFLAVLGARRAGTASHAFLLGGGAVTIAGLAVPVDVWAAHACYRAGVLLAASGPLSAALDWAGARLRSRGWAKHLEPRGAALAAFVLLAVPGSFLAWWNPVAVDAIAEASVEPISPRLLRAMSFVSENTPADAVVLASAEHAPAVAALAGRRVLRAPTLLVPPDDQRRRRLERLLLRGQSPADLADRYGLSHVFIAPGDFKTYGIDWPDDLAARGPFQRVYADDSGLQVYALDRQRLRAAAAAVE